MNEHTDEGAQRLSMNRRKSNARKERHDVLSCIHKRVHVENGFRKLEGELLLFLPLVGVQKGLNVLETQGIELALFRQNTHQIVDDKRLHVVDVVLRNETPSVQ